jgi:predicted nucleotidyltransferase
MDTFDVVLKSLLEIGFLTGSQAFGTARIDSDYDIVYSVVDALKISIITGGYKSIQSDYNAGYTIQIEGKTINLIPVHPHEFLPWYLTTKAMKGMFEFYTFESKIKKYALFGVIKDALKGMVDELQTVDAYTDVNNYIIKRESE